MGILSGGINFSDPSTFSGASLNQTFGDSGFSVGGSYNPTNSAITGAASYTNGGFNAGVTDGPGGLAGSTSFTSGDFGINGAINPTGFSAGASYNNNGTGISVTDTNNQIGAAGSINFGGGSVSGSTNFNGNNSLQVQFGDPASPAGNLTDPSQTINNALNQYQIDTGQINAPLPQVPDTLSTNGDIASVPTDTSYSSAGQSSITPDQQAAIDNYQPVDNTPNSASVTDSTNLASTPDNSGTFQVDTSQFAQPSYDVASASSDTAAGFSSDIPSADFSA